MWITSGSANSVPVSVAPAQEWSRGCEVSDIVQADSDALRALAGTLGECATAIEAITIETAVVMPGSPICAVPVTSAVRGAYRRTGEQLVRLATACRSTAAEYDSADTEFAHRLRLGPGEPTP